MAGGLTRGKTLQATGVLRKSAPSAGALLGFIEFKYRGSILGNTNAERLLGREMSTDRCASENVLALNVLAIGQIEILECMLWNIELYVAVETVEVDHHYKELAT